MDNYLQHISIHPDVRFGKPCIKGTRIAVSDVLQWLASGMTISDIVHDFPPLTEEHIRAVLLFAAHRDNVSKLIAA